MDGQLEQVALAFSRKALVYDEFGRDHANLTRMRQKVYAHLQAVTPPGSHLLELNAGTGLDATALVALGYTVHATDLAPGMIAEIGRKIAANNLQDRLSVQQCSFVALDQVTGGPFDGVYSNSGGLNCIADLTQVTRRLPALLRPGGTATVVVMPRICPWELLALPRDFRVGTRRLRPGGVMARVEGVAFRTTYFTATQVRRAFGREFDPIRLEGLSVFTPTADNKTFAVKHPRLYRRLVRLDDALCRWPPFRAWGDFFILTMRYRPR